MRLLTSRTKPLAILAAALGAVWVAVHFSPHLFAPPPSEPFASPPPNLAAPEVPTWKQAARRVEEARGEPVGRAATVRVPEELRHYRDRRRFLAVQVAETREHDLDLPEDFLRLARLVEQEALVPVKALGDHYVLYGVGGSVTNDPFGHHDRAMGMPIPLYDGWADFKDADQALAAQAEELKAEAAAKRAQMNKLSRKLRTRRRALLREARAIESRLAALQRRRKRIAYFYDSYERRRTLVAEYRRLEGLAENFGGRRYDLEDPGQRRILKGRLLSHLRPEARDMLLEIAGHYGQRFGRPLPVSSLVRPLSYQLQLGRTNPNATLIDEPPHASGLAFDLYYGHMAAAEQEYVMDLLARLEREGRLEALREVRNHFHVFVFADGQRPAESLIARSLPDVGPPPAVAARRAPASGTGKKAPATRGSARKPAPRPRARPR